MAMAERSSPAPSQGSSRAWLSSMVSARGSRFGLASIRPTSRTGVAIIAPYRTARPITPEMTLRQLLAVEALTFFLIEAITRTLHETIGIRVYRQRGWI